MALRELLATTITLHTELPVARVPDLAEGFVAHRYGLAAIRSCCDIAGKAWELLQGSYLAFHSRPASARLHFASSRFSCFAFYKSSSQAGIPLSSAACKMRLAVSRPVSSTVLNPHLILSRWVLFKLIVFVAPTQAPPHSFRYKNDNCISLLVHFVIMCRSQRILSELRHSKVSDPWVLFKVTFHSLIQFFSD